MAVGNMFHYHLAVFPLPQRFESNAALLEGRRTKDDDVNLLPGSKFQNGGSSVAALPLQTEQSQQGCLG